MYQMVYGYGATIIVRSSSKDVQVFLQQLMEEVLVGNLVLLEGYGQLLQQLLVLLNF